jgi:hypothetical protein
MKYASLVAAVLLVTLAICAWADDRFAPDVTVSGVTIDRTCAAMDQTGFKTVVDLPGPNDNVRVDQKIIRDGNDTYEWTAIVYKGSDRIAARSLLKNGKPASRLDELKLVLDNKIPLAVHGGHWFPAKNQGACPEFRYGRMGKNPKVETVATLPDGRVIKHITQDGISPYFAVETIRKAKLSYSFVITMSPTNDCCGGQKSHWATLEELKKPTKNDDGSETPVLESDVTGMKVIGEEKYNDGPFHVNTRTYMITGAKDTTEVHMTSYPYYED